MTSSSRRTATVLLHAAALWALSGCAGGTGAGTSPALTESDFASDPELHLGLDQVAVTFLEAMDEEVTPAGDVGPAGVDVFPLRVVEESTRSFVLDVSDGSRTIALAELKDASGAVVLALTPGSTSGTIVLPRGDYDLYVHSGYAASPEEGGGDRPVFLHPRPAGTQPSIGVAPARALATPETVATVLSTRSCEGCDLSGANLEKRDLGAAELKGAKLVGARLAGARLNGASLAQADLTGADLAGADLFAANLLGATLSPEPLRKLAGATLGLATWTDGTVCAEDSAGVCTPRTAPVTDDWTVFVFGHGDHNLSPSLVEDIGKMARATVVRTKDGVVEARVNVVVAADYCASQSCAGKVHPSPFGKAVEKGTQFIRITGGGAAPKLVGVVPEQNLDLPSVLQRWVALSFKAYPARRYAVVMWDHGGSWDGGFGGDSQDATAETGSMSPVRIATTLGAAMSEAGFASGTRLDFLAFDTCLMAGPEVMWEFRDLAQIYVGNAELDFGSGWNYAATLSWMSANPRATARELAVQEVADWDALHRDVTISDRLLRAHATFELAGLTRFQADMKALADAMAASGKLRWSEVARSRLLAGPQYGSLDMNLRSDYLDLGQLLSLLSGTGSDPVVATAAATALGSMRAMTVGRSMGTIRQASGQLGVHAAGNTGTPWTTGKRDAYRALAWDAVTGWSRVLDGITAASPPVPEVTASLVPGPAPLAGTLSIAAGTAVDAGGRAFVAIETQRPEDKAWLVYGDVWRGDVTTRMARDVAWDGTMPAFTDANGKAAFLDGARLAADAGRVLRSFPAQRRFGQAAPVTVMGVVDEATLELVYLLSPSATGWEFQDPAASAGATLAPELSLRGATGQPIAGATEAGPALVVPSERGAALKATMQRVPAGTWRAGVGAWSGMAVESILFADGTVVVGPPRATGGEP